MAPKMKHDALHMVEYRDDLPVLVLADSEAAAARARSWAESAGCRVGEVIGVDGADERLDRQVATGAVLAEFERDHGAVLDRLLDRMDVAKRAGRYSSVVTAPPELIGVVFARAPSVIQLCDPSDAQRMIALAEATARGTSRLQDIGKGTARLQQLSEEVGRIANILARISEDEEPGEGPQAPGDAEENTVSASAVRAIIRARRLREQYFHGELFADPAWDMLLDLMAARLDQQRVAVSSLCIAAAVPATTALRWIKTLTDHGLFVRTADPQDGRRVFIELSDKAASQLGAYLQATQRISPLVI